MPRLSTTSKPSFMAAAALLAVVGCTTEQTSEASASGVCLPAAAQSLVGRAKPTDAEAMRLTGATIVRQIVPGAAATHDLRQNRVTIATDPATGRVVSASCG
ncbi:hypothetical protein [Mesorhizobium sp. ES1-1]|uniref:hypothetical protein n=1 Tax=Mesorhizobium sp. ES1-1 TaxID=2876629 RepID=UPI001CCCB32A|nr:hypothetical protein [Mesorhizobium sp. ES1-1]MBZ9677923.1 hypothetical protein [Mesorhizobium sp. ES1-1]